MRFNLWVDKRHIGIMGVSSALGLSYFAFQKSTKSQKRVAEKKLEAVPKESATRAEPLQNIPAIKKGQALFEQKTRFVFNNDKLLSKHLPKKADVICDGDVCRRADKNSGNAEAPTSRK